MTSKQHDFSMVFHSLKIGGIFRQIHIVSFVINSLMSTGTETMLMDSNIFEPSHEILVFCNRQA